MKKLIYRTFRRLVSWVSGYGLRERFPWINLLYKKVSKSLSPRKVIVQGHVMYLDDGDSLGLAIHGEYESSETRIIQKEVTVGQVVLDIGANIGYFTLNFARLVGEQGRVYAFEPDPVSFEILKRNVVANRYHNVILESKAISNLTAEAFLQRDQYNNLDHQLLTESKSSNDISINTIRLDDYFSSVESEVDFIKMDIQGAEILALQGMRNILLRRRCVKLLTEFWPFGLEHVGGKNSASQYLHELEDLGFVIFEINGIRGELHLTSSKELLEKYLPSSRNYANLLCVRKDE
jgi:FkbM family methyltransferase